MSETTANILYAIEIIILLAIFIPTMIAFFTGAPWVPTPMKRVRRMLELADIKPGDRVYDLGCGDGRLVQEAAKIYKADAIGLELSPLLYAVARIRNFLLKSRAQILLRDFRKINFSNAKAITFYLLPEILKAMGPKFAAELKPGTRIVSYAFQIDGWIPVHIEGRDTGSNLGRIFVYEIPTSVKANGSSAKK